MEYQSNDLIVKEMLIEWQANAVKALQGVPINQVALNIKESRQKVKNYLTLTGQDRFNLEVVKKINDYIIHLRKTKASLIV